MDQTPLTLSRASKPDGVIVLGSLAVKQLEVNSIACFMVNAEGVVEIVPPVEIAMDYFPEPDAIRTLVTDHKYTDAQLINYLKARDARKARNG